jgi:hypothetical protein
MGNRFKKQYEESDNTPKSLEKARTNILKYPTKVSLIPIPALVTTLLVLVKISLNWSANWI